MAAAERVREEGGSALLVLDDLTCVMEVWERLCQALATLGEERLAAGLIKDAQGREVAVPQPQSDEELVVYEGMLVSAAAAMRRRCGRVDWGLQQQGGYASTCMQSRRASCHAVPGPPMLCTALPYSSYLDTIINTKDVSLNY